MFWLFELPTVATALPTKPLLFVLPCRKNIEITQITWKQIFFLPHVYLGRKEITVIGETGDEMLALDSEDPVEATSPWLAAFTKKLYHEKQSILHGEDIE